MSAPGPETVLGKTMQVLLAFTVEETVLGFAELQARTGLPKATLHRLLGDLVGARLLEKVEGSYRLSRLVFELGMGSGKQVYFPNEQRWRAKAPAWAKEQWKRYSDACQAWCKQNSIRFSLEHDAHIEEERVKPKSV